MGVKVESREIPNWAEESRVPCIPWALLVSAAGCPSLVPVQAARPSSPPWSQPGADGAAHRLLVLLPELMNSTWCLPRPDLKVSLSLGKSAVLGLGGSPGGCGVQGSGVCPAEEQAGCCWGGFRGMSPLWAVPRGPQGAPQLCGVSPGCPGALPCPQC